MRPGDPKGGASQTDQPRLSLRLRRSRGRLGVTERRACLAREQYFWKIDYFDLALACHSPDPADPAVTPRVLTVMRADEY